MKIEKGQNIDLKLKLRGVIVISEDFVTFLFKEIFDDLAELFEVVAHFL